MKVIGYVCCLLALAYVKELTNAEESRDKFERDLFDVFTTRDAPLKIKRPFCNAFTGCGRKRSLYDNSANVRDFERKEDVRLPVILYKTLLRAVGSPDIRNALVRDFYNRDSSEIGSDYAVYPTERKITSLGRRQS